MIRDPAKHPAGPRAATNSPTRRRPRGLSTASISSISTALPSRPLDSVHLLSASSVNNHSLFSFGRTIGSTPVSMKTELNLNLSRDVTGPSFDFLPTANFDDLHSSLDEASSEFKLAPFTASSSISHRSHSISGPSAAEARSLIGQSHFNHHINENLHHAYNQGHLYSHNHPPPVSMLTSGTFNKMSDNHSQLSSNVTHSGGTTRVVIPPNSLNSPSTAPNNNSNSSHNTASSNPTAHRSSRSNSLLRRPSTANRPSTSPAVTDLSQGPGVSRTPVRRQSHYPPVSNSNMPKPIIPRKSTGSSMEIDTVSRRSSSRRPSLTSSDLGVANRSFVSISGLGDGTRSSIDCDFSTTNESMTSLLSSSRTSKARSVHSFSKPTQASLAGSSSTTALAPDSKTSRLSTFHLRSPRTSLKAAGLSAPAPPVNKRVSMMPGMPGPNHAHGLGARTISPTDARRLQRLSMHQPQANDSSSSVATATVTGLDMDVLPPPPKERRASSRSPSMIPRKATATPSSSRTTPDIHRKSYSSGLSAGSAASFNTVRTSTGSIAPRIPQMPQSASSRLPAPKALTLQNMQNQNPASDLDEDVPPVPAIPKVYNSPKDSPSEATFLDKKKLSLAFDASSIHSFQSNSTGSGSMVAMEVAATSHSSSSGSGSGRGSGHGKIGARKTSYHSHTVRETEKMSQSRKSLQPLHLPPMHIGPLSTPTANKIASLHMNNGVSPNRLSPAPKRHSSKTPTTPMTASKSSFFSRHHETTREAPIIRSSSSVHPIRISSPLVSTDNSSDDSTQLGTKGTTPLYMAPKSSVTPASAVHTSSPAVGDDRSRSEATPRNKTRGSMTATPSASQRAAAESKSSSSRPSGPRALKMPSKGSKSPPPPSSPEEQEPPTPSSMSSLRRKLSLSWKRGASKSNITLPPGLIETASALQHSGQRQEPMPPRLPTASISGKASPTASIKSNSTYLETRRRKSSISSMTTIGIGIQERHRGDWNSHTIGSSKKPIMPETGDRHAMPSGIHKLRPRPSSAAPSSSHKSSVTDLWTADMDKDDMLADEEMRKLGMRRKETEVAARALDQLRKRATAKERVSPQEAIRIARLNKYEHGEIMDYNDVYFCGTQNAQKVVGDLHGNKPNFGYDDDRGDYAIVPGDHLAYRYEIIDVLGKGSFGQVVRCIDHRLGVLVAIKIIRNKKRFHQQAIVEVNILKKLREWDPHNHHSMVNFTDNFYFRGHLCISTELLDMNLYEFIKANNFRGFSLRLIRRFTKQILSSLNLLKQRRVIHCDLKPENILIRHPLHSEIKVIDFGSSCFENEKIYTYIQSRFYRSPEVILGMTYGLPIDMWSVGCILAELYTGVPIFPGENEQEQLACIMEVFGPPEKHLIEKSTRKKLFFDSMGKPRLTVSSKGRRRRPSSKTLQQVLKCDDEAFLDFIARCLRWDPERRMRPEEAIRHEFITGHKSAPRAREVSPIKRTTTSSSAVRPLPEPPASFRRARDVSTSGTSPSKTLATSTGSSTAATSGGGYTAMRRSSNAGYNSTSLAAAGAAKRGSGVASIAGNSNLPRAAHRSASGKLQEYSGTAAAGPTAASATTASARR
ncbi:hypothetical protein TD95_002045 [Thielaviopsis punctulata]|uniref:dual-specificity kinase n=1 Tax=Thielaviopsis punctulata TaxID=72032 RepID=A0A0F4ZGM0_9PEZI|nr:hypothetical protein TD95_002045 [Thielaviopsis punctulata]